MSFQVRKTLFPARQHTFLSKAYSFAKVVNSDVLKLGKVKLCILSVSQSRSPMFFGHIIFLKPKLHGENVLANMIEREICWWGQWRGGESICFFLSLLGTLVRDLETGAAPAVQWPEGRPRALTSLAFWSFISRIPVRWTNWVYLLIKSLFFLYYLTYFQKHS